MQSHHALEHVAVVFLRAKDEPLVFFDGFHALFFTVAIRNFIAERSADAERGRALRNVVEAAGNIVVAGVVVKHRRYAVLDAVGKDREGGQPVVLVGELPVDRPPHAFEDVVEVFRIVSLDGKTAGKRTVDVVVHVDETRHDDAAVRINELCLGIARLEHRGFADLFDQLPVDGDCAVFVIRSIVSRDETAVSDE